MVGQPATVGLIDQFAKGAISSGWSLGDFVDHPVQPVVEFAVGGNFVDYAPVPGFSGAQCASEQHQFGRPAGADFVGQGPATAAVRNRANAVVGHQEFCLFIGDHQIGHQGETQPCAGRHAPDCGNHRCIHAAQKQDGGVDGVQDGADGCASLLRRARHTGYIAACHKGSPRACQNDATNTGKIPDLPHRRKEGLCQGHIDGVEGLRTIEGQSGDPCSGIKCGGYQ